MNRRGTLVCATVLLVAAVVPAVRADTAVTREGTQVQAPQDAWREPGFRLQLRFGHEDLIGIGQSPGGWGILFAVEPSLRLTPHWSLTSSLQYAIQFAPTLRGLRFATGLGTAWHPWEGLSLGAGISFAGMLADWSPPQEGAPFTPAQGSCDGRGALVNARLGYLFAVGELFATGPLLQADLIAIKCQAIPSMTAEVMRLVQVPWWWQHTFSLTWAVAWR